MSEELTRESQREDREILACPACGERSLLAYAAIMVEVLDTPGVCGRPYGMPDVVPLARDQEAVCNRRACRWEGTIGEARGPSDE